MGLVGSGYQNQVTFIPRDAKDSFIGRALAPHNLWAILIQNDQSCAQSMGLATKMQLFHYVLPHDVALGTQLTLKVFHMGVDVTPKEITFECHGNLTLSIFSD
jgi:hypothetical protein